jgi:hypothetical protein
MVNWLRRERPSTCGSNADPGALERGYRSGADPSSHADVPESAHSVGRRGSRPVDQELIAAATSILANPEKRVGLRAAAGLVVGTR